jgi:hypothetical protein
VVGSSEHGNELSGSIKGGELLDKPTNYQLLKNDSVPSGCRYSCPSGLVYTSDTHLYYNSPSFVSSSPK